ncbi:MULTISPECIES: L,D-transpeptidase family protein [Nocardioides]|uniref:L,D-transpeptidase family protein n=1 Tax=Nocardioides TaxID=1839 RepID=UPI002867BA1C|nr:L,D-transpeptidase family protein [Nocardioides sp. CGMCC 1.13656]
MVRRLGAALVVALLVSLSPVPAGAATAEPPAEAPAWARLVPDDTTQVVRTVSSRDYCRRVWCTVTQAWRKDADGTWTLVREARSSIGSRGWGKRREGDRRSPVGVYEIKVTFSTTRDNPGRMPWRRRLPTSNVSAAAGPSYNTWIEVRGATSGDRPSMRSGWVLDFNHVRLRPGVGPRPVPGRGSGIFYHTSKPGHRWAPTAGCTQVGDPQEMRWLLRWLRPEAQPRVVQGR